MIEGRFFGTMALTEPHAGSSLSDIRTRAEPADDGTYRLRGNKIFISGGDHSLSENIVHLVLAKLPDAPGGVKGISLFIVPKFLVNYDGSLGKRNDVLLAGLFHKMGWKGTTSTALNFGDNGECVGYLVGKPHHGLTYMFQMMNEARIGVGLGAVMLGYSGYLYSLDYARDRPQGRLPDSKSPESTPVPIIQHADVRRMLLTQKAYVEGAFDLCLYASRLFDDTQTGETEDVRKHAHELLDLLTPLSNPGLRNSASKPMNWRFRCSAVMVTPASTPLSSTTATTGSIRFMKALTASSPWTCSGASWRRTAAPVSSNCCA